MRHLNVRHVGDRRGVIMVVALVCMAVAVVMGGLLLKTAALQRQACDAQERQDQARWLAESALERAAARLAADAHYPGETWTTDELRDGGQVQITVERPPAAQVRTLTRVTAEYPRSTPYKCRYTKSVQCLVFTVRAPDHSGPKS